MHVTSLWEFLSKPLPQTVAWTAVLAVVVAVAFYLVQRLRESTVHDNQSANELLSNFREMHREGDLSEAEFRTIKTALGAKLQQELKDTDQTG